MALFRRLLIANRGEIALRVMRTCQEKGIETVAVYSTVDRDSAHVEQAGASCCIGDGDARDSYMNVANIICAALHLEADAVHPGYGFLSEDSRFAEICDAHGLAFIGPGAEALKLTGDKVLTREVAAGCGVPVLPALYATRQSGNLRDEVRRVGYPVVAKPRVGGGGRGILHAADEGALERHLSDRSLGNSIEKGEYFFERFLEHPRHIEVQLLADRTDGVRVAGLRDCSLQKNRQKVIEEAPPPHLSRSIRHRLSDAATRVCRTAGFSTVGTAEFLLDGDDFYFLEFNPRIQVEHTVTEMVTGLDLVWEQIRLAAGEALDVQLASEPRAVSQSAREPGPHGHAIQARVCAEWAGGPTGHAGNVGNLRFPGGPGVRVDTHLHTGCALPYIYDPLLMKIVTWGSTRAGAVQRMRRALDEVRVGGVHTNLTLLQAVADSREFGHGHYDTGTLEAIESGFDESERAGAPAGLLRPYPALST
ncbi:MAG: acetyl-CoA carboxylase biotin carboxylase subunit [Candidatus Geothermincolia bacterium]